MLRLGSILAGLGVLVLCGVLHGVWTDRWAKSAEVEEAAARLNAVPTAFAGWEGQDLELDARQRAAAGGCGYLLRRYLNRRTKEAVTVFVVCGRPGPVSVHQPDVCFQGAGYRKASEGREEVKSDPASPPAEFKTAEMRYDGFEMRNRLRILWSWSAAGDWEAPHNPRFAFARHQFLYKLYVIRELPEKESRAKGKEAAEKDSCEGFLRVLLPELRKSLFPAC
jgi:hypothetical protein